MSNTGGCMTATTMASGDVRPNKVVKKTSQRKNTRISDSSAVTIFTDGTVGSASDGQEASKKTQGIVIDGKTYTCATCKAGHRVGVCKHARERPMKATHPPGRPPAGAPKKVSCDCPKNCGCSKKDCKCARKCHCTQMMFMLVYVPAPGEEENPEEEKGSWKLGEQVTTDLKGNILTPEQVNQRRIQKEILKAARTIDSRSPSITDVASHVRQSSTTQGAGTKPEGGSCCKHREVVAARENIAPTSMQPGTTLKFAAGGCNCGTTCSCAFCPQHPNNPTSVNVARQQAIFMANHPSVSTQAIVPFSPSMPQDISCMGGQPQFAISRQLDGPSFADIRRTFPNPGYVIGYPIFQRVDNLSLSVTPYAMSDNQSFQSPIHIPALDQPLTTSPFHAPPTSSSDHGDFEFGHDGFDIGNAFVSSAGEDTWENQMLTPSPWLLNNSADSTPFEGYVQPDYLTARDNHQVVSTLPASIIPSVSVFEFQAPAMISEGHHEMQEQTPTISLPLSDLQAPDSMQSTRSCCEQQGHFGTFNGSGLPSGFTPTSLSSSTTIIGQAQFGSVT